VFILVLFILFLIVVFVFVEMKHKTIGNYNQSLEERNMASKIKRHLSNNATVYMDVSVIAPIIIQNNNVTKQMQYITDTIMTFSTAVSSDPIPVELIFVILSNQSYTNKLVEYINNQKNIITSTPKLILNCVKLSSQIFNNIRAINFAASTSKYHFLLFYPYGTRHNILRVKEDSSRKQMGKWLSSALKWHAKMVPNGITGSLVTVNNRIHSAALSVALSDNDKPTLYHRYQGFSVGYEPAVNRKSSELQQKTKDPIVSVAFPGMIINKAIFQQLNGFDEKLGDIFETIAVADLCLKVLEQGDPVIYNPLFFNQYTIDNVLPNSEKQLGFSDETIRLTSLESRAVASFRSSHGAHLKKLLKDNIESEAKVVWDFGAGSCTGWFIEAQQYCTSLENRINLRVITGRHDMCEGLPESSVKALDRMISRNLHDIDVFITHKPPERYPTFPYNGLVKIDGIPKYVVGRSMYESSILPESWATIINSNVDEVWVPSKFMVDTFAAHKVKSHKIVHVPEPIDVHFFDPLITTPLYTKENAKLKGFNFLSIFKWEERKGPEELLKAYFTEFTNEDDVSLFLVTYMFLDVERSKWRVEEEINRIVNQLKLKRGKLPAYEIITDVIPTVDMPRLYKSFDAYVLPTKGEGWGLPYIEAMAMELPTIGTNYGGQLDFMNKKNSYLIGIDGMVEGYGQDGGLTRYPKVSIDELKSIMRHTYTDRLDGKYKGKLARISVSNNFSQEVISNKVVQHIKRIYAKIYKK
jgi:glycosyltransferase involved in cell wall biosynthesis